MPAQGQYAKPRNREFYRFRTDIFFRFRRLPSNNFFHVFQTNQVTQYQASTLMIFTSRLFITRILIQHVTPMSFSRPLVRVLHGNFHRAIDGNFRRSFIMVVILHFGNVDRYILFRPTDRNGYTSMVYFAEGLQHGRIDRAMIDRTYFFNLLARVITSISRVNAHFIAMSFGIVTRAIYQRRTRRTAQVRHFLNTWFVRRIINIFGRPLHLGTRRFVFRGTQVLPNRQPNRGRQYPISMVARHFSTNFSFLRTRAIHRQQHMDLPIGDRVIVTHHFRHSQ